MRLQVAMFVFVLPGCGAVGADKQRDAAGPDASRMCDPTGVFDAPILLPGFNTAALEGVPRLTADELELYFEGTIGGTVDRNLFRAQRASTSSQFDTPTALARVNTTADDAVPSVSSDGLTLFFESNRVAGEGYHLYVATRASRLGDFGMPSTVANVNSTTPTDHDRYPFVTADGEELWFTSTRAPGLGNDDIYRASWNGSSFINIAAVAALSTSATDYLPTFSADRLTVYLSSDRPGGKNGIDIWTARRSTAHDGFPAPTPVSELNSNATDSVGWLSSDSCRLYFTSDRAGTFDIYIATRHPI